MSDDTKSRMSKIEPLFADAEAETLASPVPEPPPPDAPVVSRRGFLGLLGATGAAVGLSRKAEALPSAPPEPAKLQPSQAIGWRGCSSSCAAIATSGRSPIIEALESLHRELPGIVNDVVKAASS